jgi:hypothetical protein
LPDAPVAVLHILLNYLPLLPAPPAALQKSASNK